MIYSCDYDHDNDNNDIIKEAIMIIIRNDYDIL